MKRHVLFVSAVLFVVGLLFVLGGPQIGVWAADNQRGFAPAGPDDDVYVYVTESGDKYHKEDCRFLKKSKIKLTLEEAKEKGYKPCSVCKPPE